MGRTSEKISKVLPNTQVCFYSNKSLGSLLVNNKDKVNKFAQNGVYSIQCSECTALYIGQSGRAFETRLKEHIRSWKLSDDKSTFGKHLWENSHTFNPDSNFKILHTENKGAKLNNLEILEINRAKQDINVNIINDQIIFASSPLLYPIKS